MDRSFVYSLITVTFLAETYRPVDDRNDQIFLGLEMQIERGFGDADLIGDIVHRHRLYAFRGHQIMGRFEDRLFP